MKNKNKLSKGYNLLYSKHYQEYIQVLQCEKTAIRRTIALKTLLRLICMRCVGLRVTDEYSSKLMYFDYIIPHITRDDLGWHMS